MRGSWLVLAACVLVVAAVANALPYLDTDDRFEDDYSDNSLDNTFENVHKRACIRRGGNCDHHPDDCCYNSSCRCNLWGTNCRCQRMGLFQKWG